MHFDIVMPCFNNDWDMVRTALDSVVRQTHRDWTVWICEGRPDDAVNPPIKDLIEQEYWAYDIHHLWQTGEGISQGRNQAVAAGDSEYVVFLDADDFWLPEKLEWLNRRVERQHYTLLWDVAEAKHEAYYEEERRLITLHTVGYHKEWNQTRPEDRWFRMLFVPPTASILTVNREDFTAVGGFSEDIYYAEDMDLMVRLALYHPEAVGQIGQILTVHRVHSLQDNQKNNKCIQERFDMSQGPSLFDKEPEYSAEYLREATHKLQDLSSSDDAYDQWLYGVVKGRHDMDLLPERQL